MRLPIGSAAEHCRRVFFHNVKRGPRETAVTTIEKKSLSEWLDQLDGHDILGREWAIEDFKKTTGLTFSDQPGPALQPDNWPSYTKEEMQAALDAEGRGGYLNGDGPYVPALDIAELYATNLIKFQTTKFGRGSGFRELVGALKRAGY